MSGKLIPNSDIDFKTMAFSFTKIIVKDPQKYRVSDSDAQELSEAFTRFEAALAANSNRGTRSLSTSNAKKDSRERLEKIIQRIAHLIRTDESIAPSDKVILRIKERPSKLNRKRVPMEAPMLKFVRATHENQSAYPIHELRFTAGGYNKAKPDGAVRLELFVDLVPPNEPVPTYPGANGGRPWYLRSYTRSPIVLTPPMARVPMRVVYWARWADSSGETGPFSATAVGWIEHGTEHNVLQFGNQKHHKPSMIIEQVKEPETRTPIESMAILEAHFLSFVPKQALPENVTINRDALPSPEEESEAA